MAPYNLLKRFRIGFSKTPRRFGCLVPINCLTAFTGGVLFYSKYNLRARNRIECYATPQVMVLKAEE